MYNVYNQCNDFCFFNWDFVRPKFLKSQFGHPIMKTLAKSLICGINKGNNLI